MKSSAFSLFAASAFVAFTTTAHADVFSSQGFSGETTTLQNLPGVNMGAGAGPAGESNCVESEVSSYSWRDGPLNGTRTDCTIGNFTFSTVRGRNAPNPVYDNTYGGNPPPWEQGWRP